MKLYRSLEFVEEGRIRQTRWQQGKYVDVLLMGLLIEEYRRDAP